MHVARRLMAIALVAVASLTLCLGSASASSGPITLDGYLGKVAATLRAHHHRVYVDHNANPRITNEQAATVNSQIAATGKPIFVLLLDNNVARLANSPNDLVTRMYRALGVRQAVVGVSTNSGFYAAGFYEPKFVVDQAGPLATQAAIQNRGNAFGGYTQWVNSLAHIKVPRTGPGARIITSTIAPQHKKGTPTWVIALIVVGCIVLVVGIIFLLVFFRSSRRERRRIVRAIKQLDEDLVNDVGPNVDINEKVSTAYGQAQRNLESARTALAEKDVEDARASLSAAKRQYNQAMSLIDEARRPKRSYPDYVPPAPTYSSGSAASSRPASAASQQSGPSNSNTGTRVQAPGGQPIIINQNTYVPQQYPVPGYQNYYQGGLFGNVYHPAGYYAAPFWEWEILATDLMLTELMFDAERRVWFDDRFSYEMAQGNFTDYVGGGTWGDINSSDTWEGADTGWADWGNASGDPYSGPGDGDFGGGATDTTGTTENWGVDPEPASTNGGGYDGGAGDSGWGGDPEPVSAPSGDDRQAEYPGSPQESGNAYGDPGGYPSGDTPDFGGDTSGGYDGGGGDFGGGDPNLSGGGDW